MNLIATIYKQSFIFYIAKVFIIDSRLLFELLLKKMTDDIKMVDR